MTTAPEPPPVEQQRRRAESLRQRMARGGEPPDGKPETPLQSVNRVMREEARRRRKETGK